MGGRCAHFGGALQSSESMLIDSFAVTHGVATRVAGDTPV
jgi:hypothetical protein